jgi:predicted transcriptional regulator
LDFISQRQNISLSYLEQLFAKLRRADLVKSVRGPGGGYLLNFCRLGDFMKYSHSKAAAVFHKIVKLVKNGVLMIIPIYAKVSIYFLFLNR